MHTHTHIYIYIYIYTNTKRLKKSNTKMRNDQMRQTEGKLKYFMYCVFCLEPRIEFNNSSNSS